MVSEDITPGEALRQSREGLEKTSELAAQVDKDTEIVRTLREENHWAAKIKADWTRGIAAA